MTDLTEWRSRRSTLCRVSLSEAPSMAKWHAWVSEGSSDSVTFLQEKFDHPRGDEATGAGDTYDLR
ncbi:hypothetical protein CR513_46027, partial [Mucuna pruriens]